MANTMKLHRWIIPEKFEGWCHTATGLDENGAEHVAYMPKGTTVEQYLADNPGSRVVSNDEFYKLVYEYEISRCTGWKPCTKEHFNDMLEVLPPCRWLRFDNGQIFHVSERITGNLVNWYMQKGNNYFTRVQFADQDIDLLIHGGH